MPPKRRISAPPNRVYKPITLMRQERLPVQKKRIKYGKQTGPRVPKVDNTLTQMDFVLTNLPISDDEEEEQQEPKEEEGRVDKDSKKQGNKRRKTMGDTPSSSTIPQYHTQTITQLDWGFNSTHDEPLDGPVDDPAEKDIEGRPAEAKPKRDIFDGPYSSQQKPERHIRNSRRSKPGKDQKAPIRELPLEDEPEQDVLDGSYSSPQHDQPVRKSKRAKPAKSLPKNSSERGKFQEQDSFDLSTPMTRSQSVRKLSPTPSPPLKTSNHAMLPPPTPHRLLSREIPSSQSPATPISSSRKPLREQSVNNTPIPFNGGRNLQSSPLKPPKLEVEDTFDTVTEISQVCSTQTKGSSPAKSVRFSLPGDEVMEQEDGNVSEMDYVHLSPSVRRVANSDQQPEILEFSRQREILDSDAEDDDEEEGVLIQEPLVDDSVDEPLDQAADVDLDLNHYLESGLPGRAPTEQSLNLEHESKKEGDDATPSAKSLDEGESQENLGAETCYGDIGLETQFEADRIITPVANSAHSEQIEKHEEYHKRDASIEQTQMESQRLSTQQVHAMDPRTLESDIFVTVAHTQVLELLDRTRDHLTKAWQIPPRTSRIWLYEPKPESVLRYMAEIGPIKRPSELTNESGKGNAEFNKKINSKWTACEAIGLYELADPMTLDRLKAAEWLMRPPSKFNRVPPTVLDSLMANLMPPIFTAMSDDPSPTSSQTDTQEVEAQLMSTTRQFKKPMTTLSPSSPPPSSIPLCPPSKMKHQSIIEHYVPESSHDDDEDDEGEVDLDAPFVADSPIREPYHRHIRRYKSIEQAQTIEKPVEVRVNENPVEEEEERIPSSQQVTPTEVNQAHPSQATTVDLTQTQTQHTPENFFESSIRRVPSSTPLRLPTHRDEETQGYQAPELLVPFSMDSSQLLTKSQMLPESLLADSIFVEPPFVMDSDDEVDD